MKRRIDHRPAGHKPHPKLRQDGRFRIVHVAGKGNTDALFERRFGAYLAELNKAYRRTKWAGRWRMKRRARGATGKGPTA